MLPLLLVLIIVLVIVYSGGGNGQAASAPPTTAPAGSSASPDDAVPPSMENQVQVEVLPILERAASGQDDSVAATQDPFKTPMKLTGVLLYSDNRSRAIIEYGGAVYIVSKNEVIGDTNWRVVEIYENSVMLASEDKNLLLELNNESAGS